MAEIPTWHIAGDWFDNCSCAVACPCTFAQPPDNGFCESVLFWHVQRGHSAGIRFDGAHGIAFEPAQPFQTVCSAALLKIAEALKVHPVRLWIDDEAA